MWRGKQANCGIYYARQLFFKTGKFIGKYDLDEVCRLNPHFQFMCDQAAQQTLRSVAESFASYRGLLKAFKQGELIQKPRIPNYRTKGGLAVVAYPKQALRLKDGVILITLGSKVKAAFGVNSFELKMPSSLNFADIKELQILPRNRCFYAEFVYKQALVNADVDPNRVLGVDHGINNWLTCVSNVDTSFIIDGKHLKSMNQWFNKQVAILKEGRQGFWSNRLACITEKRNRQMRDAINKTARLVVNHCLRNRIGTIVFGWNQGQKQQSNMGSKNNQKFAQIPTGRLKDRIAQLCVQHGIQFVETEESYTSIASFVDADPLPNFGGKPEGWKESGRRVKRGLYRTALNWYLNADCNGAANIIRKVATTLGFNLSGVGRGSLTAPQRIKLWSAKKMQKVTDDRLLRSINSESPVF